LNDSAPAFLGLIDRLRRLADNLVGTARDRLDLLGLELQEEKLRLVRLFVWISAALLSAMMAIGFLSLTVVFLASPRTRPAVLIGLTVIYAVAALFIALGLRRRLAQAPRVFEATVDELTRDRSCFDTPSREN